MPGSNLGQMFNWRPALGSLFRACGRTGFFAGLSTTQPQQPQSPLLRLARDLPTLSAAAAVGLEIILHDVNVDKKPGVVTRVNLQAALAKTNTPESDSEQNTASEISGDDSTTYTTTSSISTPTTPTYTTSESSSIIPTYHSLAQNTEEKQEDSVGLRETESSGFFGLFDVIKSWFVSDNATDSDLDHDFVTCREIIYGNLMIPLPESHILKVYQLSDVEVFDERFLGGGTFANVFQASLVFGSKRLPDSIVHTVAIKNFHVGREGLSDVLEEADISAFMASKGVGPETLGLLEPEAGQDSPPSLLMSYKGGSTDLRALFAAPNKPSRTTVLDILVQAARLLTVAHSHSFLHNDIKSCNMIVTPNPLHAKKAHHGTPPPTGVTGTLTEYSRYRVYIIDFGQATYREGARYCIPVNERGKLGPYTYLAPEVIEGEATSIGSESYSFGIMLKLSCKILRDPELKSDLEPLINQCLVPFPTLRPMMEEIERWLAAMMPSKWIEHFIEYSPSAANPVCPILSESYMRIGLGSQAILSSGGAPSAYEIGLANAEETLRSLSRSKLQRIAVPAGPTLEVLHEEPHHEEAAAKEEEEMCKSGSLQAIRELRSASSIMSLGLAEAHARAGQAADTDTDALMDSDTATGGQGVEDVAIVMDYVERPECCLM